MKYTAEEVRDYADACRLAHNGPVIADMLTELAERIKVDESAARVDQVGELLAIIHGDGGHYQAEHGLQKAAKDAQEKVIQMMTKIATPEPVAQPADSGLVPDGWVLVPREPTKAMLDAAMAREDDEPLTDWGKIIPAPHAEIYKAMLTGVPQLGEPT